MGPVEFLKKCSSTYLWLNIAAMVSVVVILAVGVKFGIDLYTRHGEVAVVPNVVHKSMIEARNELEKAGFDVEVNDTGYVKTLPADCVLEIDPLPGSRVKVGHTVQITVNASSAPTIALPDIVQNSSMRAAMARLKALGFNVGIPQYVNGEKDWVYGVLVDGRPRSAGDRIPIEKVVIIQVGNGYSQTDSTTESADQFFEGEGEDEQIDEFSEVE